MTDLPARCFRPALPLLLGFCLLAPFTAAAQFSGPEPATGRKERTLSTAGQHMVAAANSLAAEAGREMLRQGGSAVDAAIAAELVLGLVEPQSSGLGGGGFMVVAAPGGEVTTYDGRETAPAATSPDRFLLPDGQPMPFFEALDNARAVGVPGLAAMMKLAHDRHGRLPWADLFQPAIRLAEEGFPAQPRMVEVLTSWRHLLETRPDMRATYYRDGAGPPAIGEMFRNPALAETMRRLAADGPQAMHEGAVGQEIVRHLRSLAGPDGPATPTEQDLAQYRALERDAVCAPYRQWQVCGMAPPSAGGIAVLQILGMLEAFPMAELGADDPAAWHFFAEASRRAYADREVFVGDPAFVKVPVRGLIDSGYLAGRAADIERAQATRGTVPAGDPPWREGRAYAPGSEPDAPSTTHLSVVDGDGLTVAMTNSVEFAFGSGIVAGGMVLNNELTDFAFVPTGADGLPVANAPAGGKRPRSSMAPMVVFDAQGRPVLTIGSPGGTAIIAFVAQAMVAILDWGMDPQAALDLPHLVNRNGSTVVEAGAEGDALAEALRALGHEVERADLNSGLHAILVTPDGLQGGVDPRRDGAALGD